MAKVEFLEPGQEPMTLNRDKRGQRGHKRHTMEKSDIIKIVIFGALFLLCIGYGLTWLFGGSKLGGKKAEAAAEEPVIIRTVGPLETPASPTPNPQPPASALEPAQLTATAVVQAAINRPAANPQTSPYLVGVVTYETGCPLSNLGFTTSGVNGTPYYLYLQTMLDRNPFMQMVQLRGYIQKFKECDYPVLMVAEIFWLDGTATPAPLLAEYLPIISGTATITAGWGSLAAYGLPTPDKNTAPVYDGRRDPASPYYTGTITITPYPTYTPYPSATPYVPPPRSEPPSSGGGSSSPATPTKTPTPTATPVKITLSGAVVAVAGCSVSNLAVNAGVPYFLIFEGAQMPGGDPTQYSALVIGLADRACDGYAIRAQQIQWIPLPTSTPTLTATTTSTPTPTGTSIPPTNTPTPTLSPTATATTSPPTTEPTEEPTPTQTTSPATTEPTEEPTP